MLVTLRHAAPSSQGICAGSYELPVQDVTPSLHGVLRKLARWPIVRLYTSPALRCVSLAEPIGRALGVVPEADERLRELHFGEWEGRAWTEIAELDSTRFEAWSHDWKNAAPPGGESVPQLENRLQEWLQQLPRAGVLAVTHAGPIRALGVLLEGHTWEEVMGRQVPYLEPRPLIAMTRYR